MKAFISKLNRQLFMILLLSVAVTTGSHAKQGVKRIHMKIVSAPVVANGTTAHEPAEFNILLRRQGVSADMAEDPGVPGLQIPKDGRMDVELGGSFISNPDLTGFLPGRNIIITTGPQNPVKPNTETVSGGFWGVSFDPSEPDLVSIFPKCGKDLDGVVVACQNLDADAPGGLNGERAGALGFKVIHIRPDSAGQKHTTTPFYNGPAGSIGVIYVRIYDADDILIAAGSASVVFRPRVGPQVHLSNAATRDDGSIVSLTNYQHVAPGTEMINTELVLPFAAGLPYAPQFLLFANFGVHDRDQFPTGDVLPGEDEMSSEDDKSFIPFPGIDGVTVVPSRHKPHMAKLVQDGARSIGRVIIRGPGKRSGAEILANDVATKPTGSGNGSLLFVPVKVGDIPGDYKVIVHLNGGGTAVNTVVVGWE